MWKEYKKGLSCGFSFNSFEGYARVEIKKLQDVIGNVIGVLGIGIKKLNRK